MASLKFNWIGGEEKCNFWLRKKRGKGRERSMLLKVDSNNFFCVCAFHLRELATGE